MPEMKGQRYDVEDEHCNLYHSWKNGSPHTLNGFGLVSGGGKEENKVKHKNHPTNSYLGFYLKLSFMRNFFPFLGYECESGSDCRAPSLPCNATVRLSIAALTHLCLPLNGCCAA